MALFIQVEVDPTVASNPDLAKKLVEVCPVNIFSTNQKGDLEVVDKHLDECTLCELCLNAAPPGTVKVKKLYGDGDVMQRA